MNMMHADAIFSKASPALMRNMPNIARLAGWIVAILLTVGLFGRIMAYPLAHDEQLHVAAARLMFTQPLYEGLGYSHLPGLPLLLGGFFAMVGSDHLLQTGRVLIIVCWLATAALLRLIARRHGGGDRLAIVTILVLAAGELLGRAGMLVTNNFLPIPFAMLGFHLFVSAEEEDGINPRMIFGAGAAIGFAIIMKVSYVFLIPPVAVAAFLMSGGLGFAARVRLVLLPLLFGGIIGALPGILMFASDPYGMFAHTVRYFTGGHLAYWQHSTEPKAMSLSEKWLVAENVWLSGSGLLAALLVGIFGWNVAQKGWRSLCRWPILLAAALAAMAAVGAFAPTPAFPQYYEPPVPFLILLFILLYSELDTPTRARLLPVLVTVSVLALAMMVPRLMAGVADAARPSHWTGNAVHDQGERIRTAIATAGAEGKIATLSPIVALEGHLSIYQEFAAGPFLYRVADYLPEADRAYFVTTSPHALPAFLDRDKPAAIITGNEPEFDPAFVRYAQSRGYVPVSIDDPEILLFIKPRGGSPAVVQRGHGQEQPKPDSAKSS